MRKVLVSPKKWTRTGYEKDGDEYEALFHEWGVDYEELDNGPANFSVAIIEMSDGTVRGILPHWITFVS